MTSSIQADLTGVTDEREAPSFLTLRQLGADTLVYGIGGGVTKILGFLLVLVYTRVFTPGEYGSLEMLNIIGIMTAFLLVLGLDSAQTVYVSQRALDHQSRRDIVSAIIQWKAVWGLVVVTLLLLLSPILNHAVFGDTLHVVDFAWAFGAAYFTAFISQMTDLARVLRKRSVYLLISTAQPIIVSAFILAIILLLRRGFRGYLEGLCLGTAMVALFALWSFRDYIIADLRPPNLYKSLLKFGMPLVPGALAMYVLLSSAHWIIASRFGRVDVGIYAVAVKFASVITLLVSVLQAAWLPYGLESLSSHAGRVFFSQILLAYVASASLSVAVLGFAGPYLIRTLIPAGYAGAGSLIALAVVAPLFFGFYYLFSIQAVMRAGRTFWLTGLATGCALLNVALSMGLGRLWGMQGVILGTATSAVVLAVVTLHVSVGISPIPLSLRTVETMAVLTLITAVVFAIPSAARSGRYVMLIINLIAAGACCAAIRYRIKGERDVPRA